MTTPNAIVTIGDAINMAVASLAGAGVPQPRLEARLLVQAALEVGPETVFGYPERDMPAGPLGHFQGMLAARLERRPMAHILGEREFWSLPIKVTPATLVPRPDSETVVETVLQRLPGRAAPLRILDLGTGGGCLLLALLSELGQARGLGIDRSGAALAVARENAIRLGLDGRASFATGDWLGGVAGVFDVVVANPPYIPDADIDGLEPEVARFEPRPALAGGRDGLDAYRALLPGLCGHLARGGFAVLEHGLGQADEIIALAARAAGLAVIGAARDLGGHRRCLVLGRGRGEGP